MSTSFIPSIMTSLVHSGGNTIRLLAKVRRHYIVTFHCREYIHSYTLSVASIKLLAMMTVAANNDALLCLPLKDTENDRPFLLLSPQQPNNDKSSNDEVIMLALELIDV